MRITKRIRDEAIEICAIAASAEWPPSHADRVVLDGDFDPDAGDLADEASNCCLILVDGEGWITRNRIVWAEAECMLREGWTP